MVLSEPVSFWGGVDHHGTIIDAHHPQVGTSLTGSVLVMHTGRGSSSASSVLAELIRTGQGPVAIILEERDAILALAAFVAEELYGVALPIVELPGSTELLGREADLVTVTSDVAGDVATIRLGCRGRS